MAYVLFVILTVAGLCRIFTGFLNEVPVQLRCTIPHVVIQCKTNFRIREVFALADSMESWKSEDYFDRGRENPFRFIRDDETTKEEEVSIDDR